MNNARHQILCYLIQQAYLSDKGASWTFKMHPAFNCGILKRNFCFGKRTHWKATCRRGVITHDSTALKAWITYSAESRGSILGTLLFFTVPSYFLRIYCVRASLPRGYSNWRANLSVQLSEIRPLIWSKNNLRVIESLHFLFNPLYELFKASVITMR